MKRVALITGASSGIGMELARIHGKNGGDLVIVARRKEKLEKLKIEIEESYGQKVYIIVKDLSRVEAAQEIYDELKREKIEVEYLINNAGFGGQGKFHERKWETDLAMLNVNILALTNLTRLILPDMVKRRRGKILNTSSTAGFIPGPLQAVYYATKAYVTSFSNAISEELKDSNITVTALLPGATETEFATRSGMDKTKLFNNAVSAKRVAQDGYDAMLAGKLEVISGIGFPMNIMFHVIKLLPKKILLSQIYKMQEAK